MIGQYNASKNSLGTQKKYINIWLDERPRSLCSTKQMYLDGTIVCMVFLIQHLLVMKSNLNFLLMIRILKPVMTENNFTLVGLELFLEGLSLSEQLRRVSTSNK